VTQPFITLNNITCRFGPVTALDSVSLDVRADELLVVLGPTGAGKTTLLRTIAGLEAPQCGSIKIRGQDVTADSPAARDVALVFQDFSLYPNWSVRRNLEFPLKAPGRDLNRRQIDERVVWAARLLRIEPLLDRKSHRLSGGEMQRVAIGRAIVRHPSIFLMDEPLTNLDAKLREALRVELGCLRRQLDTPMVYVTHDQAEALSMGDRIIVIAEGRVLQTGTPEEIYRKPSSPVVARQLGQPAINILHVRNDDGFWKTATGLPLVRISENATRVGGSLPDGGETVIGVRPENISPDGGRYPATVRVVEQMGPAKILLVEWSGQNIHIFVPATYSVEVGDRVFPSIKPEDVIVW